MMSIICHVLALIAIPCTLGVLIVLWGTRGPPPGGPIIVDDLGVPHALEAFDEEGETIP